LRNFSVSRETYISRGAIREEYGVVDLHIGTTFGIDSTPLKVACPPPGIGAKKSRKFLGTASELLSSYIGGSVALFKGAVVDLHGTRVNTNSSALKVACSPPGHGRKIRKILETVTLPLT
jgi:hypothetical protein